MIKAFLTDVIGLKADAISAKADVPVGMSAFGGRADVVRQELSGPLIANTGRSSTFSATWILSIMSDEVRLQLHALAYNLGNFLRTLALPEAVEHWSLTTLREKLIKIGAKVVQYLIEHIR